METIRAAIIDRRSTAVDEDEFIQHLNALIKDHGDQVCPIIFHTLANVDLPINTATKYWLDVLNHRTQLIHQLNRKVTLITAMGDYLQSYTRYLSQPCLVDAGNFERVVSGITHDNLTGLYNRPYFDETYEQQVSLAKRYHTDLSVLFLDIDDFKDVNDSMGHFAGDFALQEVARIISGCKRESDIAARYGGEEFILLMPHTSSTDACILAERIRREIERTELVFKGTPLKLTISGGMASYPLNSRDPKDLLFMADSAVYLAKGSGKNTVCQFRDEQRRHLRVKIRRPILIKELGFADHLVLAGNSKDIGMGGILLENSKLLPVGSLQEISLTVDDTNERLLLIGKVLRVEKCGEQCFNVGLRFSFKEMEKEASNRIAGFLRGSSFPEKPYSHLAAVSH